MPTDSIRIATRNSKIELYVAVAHPAQSLEPFDKRRHARFNIQIVFVCTCAH